MVSKTKERATERALDPLLVPVLLALAHAVPVNMLTEERRCASDVLMQHPCSSIALCAPLPTALL